MQRWLLGITAKPLKPLKTLTGDLSVYISLQRVAKLLPI